jgi:hypothetical protein
MMTMRRSPLHGILFCSMLAATGCSAFAAGPDPSHSVRAAASGLGADGAAHARPVLARARLRTRSAALPGIGTARAPGTDAPFLAPAEGADTMDLVPGALLDVWLNDRRRDVRTLSSERSLGTAVVQGDFFRYNTVNSDPDLRGFWGQPLLLKWSAILEIPEGGPHVFESELSKERGGGAMELRTLVRVNDETVFEREIRVFGGNQISQVGSRVLPLTPGFYRLEVWLSAKNGLALSPSTRLGTFLRIRAPGRMTAEPVQSSRIWHRVR